MKRRQFLFAVGLVPLTAVPKTTPAFGWSPDEFAMDFERRFGLLRGPTTFTPIAVNGREYEEVAVTAQPSERETAIKIQHCLEGAKCTFAVRTGIVPTKVYWRVHPEVEKDQEGTWRAYARLTFG